ncbi:MAG TPA: ThuA domain-containing protein [Flavilitoribacter sp.]|nr:ThuA domain-containing protein [Flavilitoribacter sp.]
MKSQSLWLTLLVAVLLAACTEQPREKKVLIFSRTMGFRHDSIEEGQLAIKKLGRENGFNVFSTEDPTLFKDDFLSTFSAVIFLNTTGDALDNVQQAAFERFIQAGGGYVGVHSAADTEYDWPWYGKLVGAYFQSHPRIQEAQMDVVDDTHLSTKKLGAKRLTRTDEWYNYKSFNPDVHLLIKLDESSYEGGNMNGEHPIAWYHDFDGGRAFYTGWGHTKESYSEELFLKHLLGGINYAIGKNKIDYSKATTYNIPPENRFVKTILTSNLDEPMELDAFSDGRIIFVERKGAIKVWNPETLQVDSITTIPVFSGLENGLMGIAIDPDYDKNHWVYVYYATVTGEPCNQISRFNFDGKTWDYDSEKVVLQVKNQRETCCHSGGSLEFDAHGNLFLSVGDDTNPFASDGFAPIDERPGRSSWDAQRSAGNTNDLRGKILRIHPEPDGSYTIPKGNLFPEGTPNTRPEIFVMGCRNPFRISIDKKRDWLYWGDVGPDSGKDGDQRGPKGFDMINQAQQAGNFGWPYFRGGGSVYYDYNFATGQSNGLFNKEHPINDSPNNTGLRELPPYTKSLIWYSYDESPEFPWVGTGGKNPMAGPFFYSSDFEDAKNPFPPYFDNKLFIYEWMRHWIYIVTLDSAGHFVQADPFMPNGNFSRPMDMLFGKDGALYMLEYGEQWFAKNMDARLTRIEYVKGNRKPIARIEAPLTAGAAPLTLTFDGTGSEDYDGDKISYEWKFTGDEVQDRTAFPTFTFTRPGIYQARLRVKDAEGNFSDETRLEIQVGNAPPKIEMAVSGNNSFYWDGQPIQYTVKVSDKEDGSTEDHGIDPGMVHVAIDFLPQGFDLAQVMGHQVAGAVAAVNSSGKNLIEKSDCKSCHAEDKRINGPSFLDVARKYTGDTGAPDKLAQKILTGGGGVWGETAMAAHPQLSNDQAREMVKYILSLAGGGQDMAGSMPIAGTYPADRHNPEQMRGAYVLMATYNDRGAGNIRSISTQQTLALIAPRIQLENTPAEMRSRQAKLGTVYYTNDAITLDNGQYAGLPQLDLTDVGKIVLHAGVKSPGIVELHLDQPGGPLVGQAVMTATEKDKGESFTLAVEPTSGKHDIYVVVKNGDAGSVQALLDWIEFQRTGSAISMAGG